MGIQPLGTSSGSILKLILFPSFCTNFGRIPFTSLFYMIFCFISYTYIQPKGKPLWHFFYGNFDHRLHVSKKIFAPWFYAHFFFSLRFYAHFFMTLYNVYSPWVQTFDVNRKALSLWSFVTSFKKTLQPLILHTSFKGRQQLDVNRNLLSLRWFATSLNIALG